MGTGEGAELGAFVGAAALATVVARVGPAEGRALLLLLLPTLPLLLPLLLLLTLPALGCGDRLTRFAVGPVVGTPRLKSVLGRGVGPEDPAHRPLEGRRVAGRVELRREGVRWVVGRGSWGGSRGKGLMGELRKGRIESNRIESNRDCNGMELMRVGLTLSSG